MFYSTKLSGTAKKNWQFFSVIYRTFLTNTTSFRHFYNRMLSIQVMSISVGKKTQVIENFTTVFWLNVRRLHENIDFLLFSTDRTFIVHELLVITGQYM